MGAITSDLKYALRSYRRTPGFAAVAIVTLALGIGGATAIYSVVDGILLRPLPYPEPTRLVKVGRTSVTGTTEGAFSAADFLDVKREIPALAHLAGFREDISDVTGTGEPVRVPGVQTTASFFDVLQVTALVGRVYSAEDEGRGAVAVISEGLWQRQFGRRPDIVGTHVRVNGTPTEILGVVRASVRHPLMADLWTLAPGDVPTSPIPSDNPRSNRDIQYFGAMARLASGASLGDANTQLDALGQRLSQEFPDSNRGESFVARPLAESLVVDVRAGLLVLLGAVACVLLIACANVAGLMLTRSLARRRELAVRASLGASGWQLARQLMVESLVLALVGGAAGLVLAAWSVDLLMAVAPEKLPRMNDVELDWRVAAIASLATTIVGLLAGLAPALQSTRPQLNEDLKDGGRTGTAIRTRFRSGLVVGEVAAALVLLIGAGLMLTSLSRLRSVDPGFRTTSLAAVELPLPQSRYAGPAQGRFYRQLLERLQANPVTARAAMVFPLPLRGSNAQSGVEIEGEPESRQAGRAPAELNMVSPEYFETMGLRLLRGRGFGATDVDGQPGVVIINERLAAEFGDVDPIGRRINLGDWVTVVGIVSDARRASLEVAPKPNVYLPYEQFTLPFMSVVIRTDGAPSAVALGGEDRGARARSRSSGRDRAHHRADHRIIHRPAPLPDVHPGRLRSAGAAPRRRRHLRAGELLGLATHVRDGRAARARRQPGPGRRPRAATGPRPRGPGCADRGGRGRHQRAAAVQRALRHERDRPRRLRRPGPPPAVDRGAGVLCSCQASHARGPDACAARRLIPLIPDP